MISRTKKVLSALALAGALAMGVAAPAYAENYPPVTPAPEANIVITGTVTPGATITVTFPAAVFANAETVTFILTGESASGASLANMVKFAVETANLGSRTAAADGSVNARVVLPSNASGTYTLTGTSASQPGGVSAAIRVSAAGGDSGGDAIAETGTDSTLLLTAWIGGGVLVLAGGSILVARTVRRNREGVHS
ncbi:hypothetical protein [Microbacterium sp.]|jgi:hypothetical protein|uniref:hypothetical protein n=1 Tax=Microbacterium sp. TaxID=51671 RepID=UPI0037C65237